MRKDAVIIGAAPEGDRGYILPLLASLQDPFIICADNGVRTALELGILPHLVIGDFDSATEGLTMFPQVEHMHLPAEKDDTDLRVCVDEAVARGAQRLYLVNVSGGRLDHYLGNLGLLEYLEERKIKTELHNAQNIVSCSFGGDLPIRIRAGYKFLSVIPLDERLTNVVMKDFKYPLFGITVERKTPVTISNEITGKTPFVSFEGRALLIYSKD